VPEQFSLDRAIKDGLLNQLSGETSPYLLQHSDNPVDWYPWGAVALSKAHDENKPILLSIGYSACHWCHVMAHESFEDDATAGLMNELFINIKVDREERPDIDKIYQTAQYLLTQNQGGWPLTMFLTPDDHVPFLGGTYFPPQARHGLPAFKELLAQVASVYNEREADIRAQNVQVLQALAQIQTHDVGPSEVLTDAPLKLAREQAGRAFDHRFGGFTRAPKFPHPSGIERLLRDHRLEDAAHDDHALHMATYTLKRMASGGIYDHLGGGFCRYSVDDQWLIPHFEKMLYDNGPLLGLYAHAWQIDHDPLFEQVVHETVAWVAREMTAPDGGFYSSLDADSEGEEGKFYAWNTTEVSDLLGDDYEPFARRFGLDRPANFETRWHLRIAAQFQEISNVLGDDALLIEKRVEASQKRLFARRELRVRPSRDDKILTSWNALMIKGLAIAGSVFQRPDYLDRAERAIDFIFATLWQDGRLLATYKDGNAHLNAYLDDYAFLIDALLHCLAARWRDKDLRFAIDLAEALLANFQDQENGGFYFTSHDHEALILRTKTFTDDALPAGNGIAAWSLARLGHLLGETRYLTASERTIAAAWPAINQAPGAHNAMLLALEEFLMPPTSIILRGQDRELAHWEDELNREFNPRRSCFSISSDHLELPGLLAQHRVEDTITAYVCRGHQCLPPVTKLGDLIQLLDPD
jgi:uncharacterized protein YyaL (SSP411 family)